MQDGALLERSLRAAAAMRDQVVVVRLDAAAVASAELEPLAAKLALLRSLDLRVIVVLDADPNGQAEPHAHRLTSAIARHGQRAVGLSSAGIVSVSAATPALPEDAAARLTPTVDPLLLVHLCMLRYIPLLYLPILDESGATVDCAADDVAAAVGKYLGASMLVFLRHERPLTPPTLAEACFQPIRVAATTAGESLLTTILHTS